MAKVKKVDKKAGEVSVTELSDAQRDLRVIPMSVKMLHSKKHGNVKQYLLDRGISVEAMRDYCVGYLPPLKDKPDHKFKKVSYHKVKEQSVCHEFFPRYFHVDNPNNFEEKDLREVSLTEQGIQPGSHYLPWRLHNYICTPWFTVFVPAGRTLEIHRWVTGTQEYATGLTGRRRKNKVDNRFRFFCEKNFTKSHHFYGINVALEHIVATGEIVLVEGEMDVLALYSIGIRNAVGVGSSTVSGRVKGVLGQMEQLRLLCKLGIVKRVKIMFDGDVAGRKGMTDFLKKCKTELNSKIPVESILLPDNADPNSYAQEHGAKGLVALGLSKTKRTPRKDALEYSVNTTVFVDETVVAPVTEEDKTVKKVKKTKKKSKKAIENDNATDMFGELL